MPFVSMEDGTGLVHTAPGHGKEDFAIGQREGLEVACPVDEAGRFLAGAEPFVGRGVLEVNADIVAWLKERGRLLAASTFVHAYPHCWRCRQPVIFRATDQWFMIIDHAPAPLAVDAAGGAVSHRDRALALIEAVRWDPASSQNRIRESVRLRPDWCLSRQRSWGVGIPAVYCEACGEAILDPGVMRRAVELTRAHGSDAWYERAIEEFLPPGFACPACGAAGPFRRESDILDVWFDSGSTHRAVRATHPGLDAAWRRAEAEGGRVVYFEGPDQHRGWFNSSLMVGAGTADRAPYTDVCTHGWVLDGEGRAMHKSLGNDIQPRDVVKKYGAEIVRWWALATDWRTDVRVSDEILERVSDAYRKVRNTFRFLLGNLGDFSPAQAAAARAAHAPWTGPSCDALRSRIVSIREAWEALEFHRALDLLLGFCTVDLSAVFLDVSKDRLYTLAPDDPARRSAQTVLWQALHDLTIAVSPALVFTAEEVWQHHPALLRRVGERAPGALAGASGRRRRGRGRVGVPARDPRRGQRRDRAAARGEGARHHRGGRGRSTGPGGPSRPRPVVRCGVGRIPHGGGRAGRSVAGRRRGVEGDRPARPRVRREREADHAREVRALLDAPRGRRTGGRARRAVRALCHGAGVRRAVGGRGLRAAEGRAHGASARALRPPQPLPS